MIPKIIHYCWFGRNPKPKLFYKCKKSWERKCPDYQIVEWNEDNFEILSCPLYVRQAYEAKKWAFVTDFVRLWIVHEYGGIYLDTDVELLKNLDCLLGYTAYFGFEKSNYIATGLGFGAVKGANILKVMMDDYINIPFCLEKGKYDTKPCPVRNTEAFLRLGLVQDNSKQILGQDILILPSSYLSPIDYYTGKKEITDETISIHWYSASWHTKEDKEIVRRDKKHLRKLRHAKIMQQLRYFPNRVCMKLLGEKRYETIKRYFKRGK